MKKTKFKKILSTGNEAISEGAIQGGCRFYAGYPITPQNEIPAYFSRRMPEVGGTFIQSESELSAINMVLGASAAGMRAMTSSSSPGISLKQEGISYIAAMQLPALIINMMRGGPGLGDIRPAQSDYFQSTKGGGHGDYRLVVYAPSNVQEGYDFAKGSFDLSEKYRIPVMILGDGILGQMMEPFNMIPGDVSGQKKVKKDYVLDGCKGREPKCVRSLYLKEGVLENHNLMLQAKYRKIEKNEVLFEEYKVDDAKLVLVAYGSTSRICRSVVTRARDMGLKIGLLRPITLWPFPTEKLQDLAQRKKTKFMAVEMSAGQMVEDVRLAVEGKSPVYFYGRMGGGIPKEEKLCSEVRKILRKK